jgi:putative aminopeptidase FrvX
VLSALVLLFFGKPAAQAQVEFRKLDEPVIQARLESFSKKNDEREAELKKLFLDSGCPADHLSERLVKKKLAPNVICILPGQTDGIILVGAHFDKVKAGEGVADNWSGASLLPSLLYSLNDKPHRHTFVFVGFTGEELGLVGSQFYANKLSVSDQARIVAMVNMDTLGLGTTQIWGTHADRLLQELLIATAHAMDLQIGIVNVDGVGSSDSESFAKYKIPRITIHSVTQETWPILHTDKDRLSAIKMNDYYGTYRLISAYLSYLDSYLGQHPAPSTPSAAGH